MKQEFYTWHSKQLDKDMSLFVYGQKGIPILAFPSENGSANDWEEHGMVEAIEEYIEKGRVQLFTVNTVDSESWLCENGINPWRTARQEAYYNCIIEEVLPYIHKKNKSEIMPIVAGVGMGANHAAIIFLRRPDLFQSLLALSGIYDVRYFFDDYMDSNLYDNAPERFLENMPPDHAYIELYNKRKMIFCVGQGYQEFDGVKTLKSLERIFITKSIDAWCDYWGYDVSHDWYWWKEQIQYFLPEILGDNDNLD